MHLPVSASIRVLCVEGPCPCVSSDLRNRSSLFLHPRLLFGSRPPRSRLVSIRTCEISRHRFGDWPSCRPLAWYSQGRHVAASVLEAALHLATCRRVTRPIWRAVDLESALWLLEPVPLLGFCGLFNLLLCFYSQSCFLFFVLLMGGFLFILDRTRHKHGMSFWITSPKGWLGLGCPEKLSCVRYMIKHKRQVHKIHNTQSLN